MNKKWKWTVGPIGLIFVVMFCLFVGLLLGRSLEQDLGKTVSAVNPSSSTTENKMRKALKLVAKSQVDSLLSAEARRVGRVDSDPKGSRSRMERFAKTLGVNDMVKLKNVVMDRTQSTDKRMVSVYMLSQVKETSVIKILGDVILSPIPEVARKNRFYEDELVIRAQAVEGFRQFRHLSGAQKALKNLFTKVKDSFLKKQIGQFLDNG